MARHSIEYAGIDHPQYWQGVGVAYTNWDYVYTGIGSTPRDAAMDALENAAQDGRDTARIGVSKFSQSMPRELARAYRENDECELQCYVVLWMREGEPSDDARDATDTARRIHANISAYRAAYGERSLG